MLSLTGRGTKLRPKGPKPEARGGGVLGEGQPNQLRRSGGSAVSSPSGVRGGAPKNMKFGDLEIHYRNALYNVLRHYRKNKTLRGAKRYYHPSIFLCGAIAPITP